MTRRRTPTLLHRGYLYAQKHGARWHMLDNVTTISQSAARMRVAKAWREGYLAAQRDARKTPR